MSVLSTAQTTDSLQLLASQTVYFEFGDFGISPDADVKLRAFANALIQQQADSVHLTAHTDHVGSSVYNLALSKKRGKAVISALQEVGVRDTSIFYEAYFGEAQPVASNTSEKGRARNRRVNLQAFRVRRLDRVVGRILDPETGKGISATVMVQSPTLRDSVQTDTSGRFSVYRIPGERIRLDIFAKNYFFATIKNPIPGNRLEVALPPLKVGATIDLKNFYFVGGQAVLLPESEPELPRLLQFMRYNENAQIEIAGHVNRPNEPPAGTDTFHYRLSVERAQTIYNYLLENGISDERMTFKGYANWEMRYPNALTEAEQSANRRVEIRVLALD